MQVDETTGEIKPTGLIYGKLADITTEVGVVGKDSRNTQQNYNFRGIDTIYNALHGLFAKHRVVCIPSVVSGTESREERKTSSGGTLMYTLFDMRFTFYAEDGSNVTATTRGEAMDSGDKASNKAMSAAHKYALVQVFMLPTAENIDTENYDHQVAPKETAQAQRNAPAPSQAQRNAAPHNAAPARQAPPVQAPAAQGDNSGKTPKSKYRAENESYAKIDISDVPNAPPNCPKCNGAMWDNIASPFFKTSGGLTKSGKIGPVFTCKDKECKNANGFVTSIFAMDYQNGNPGDAYYPSPEDNPYNAGSAPAPLPQPEGAPLDMDEMASEEQIADLRKFAEQLFDGQWEDVLKDTATDMVGHPNYFSLRPNEAEGVKEAIKEKFALAA